MIKENSRAVIGPQTLIELPKFGIKKIPAKVDTGADSSSIWASSISEVDGRLSFVLFGPSSKFFTGEKLSTRDYEVISVKNSFGVTQYRYRVRLAVVVENTSLKVKFTLADRSRNNLPVLIGRRTLMGRFVVDVANAPLKKFEILVLNTKFAKLEDTDAFLKNVKKHVGSNVKFTASTYKNIKFTIDKGCKAELIKQKKSLDKFGLVYFKTAVKERDLASCTAHYLSGQDVRYINRAVLMNFSDSKLLQYIIMANAKIRVPKTVFINLAILGSHYFEVKTKLGLPFVLKDIEGKKGRNNYLINSENDFKKAIKAAKANGLQMVAQKYIPNDGDYRVLVFGKQVPLVIHRKAKTGHINNTSVGAEARIVEKGEVPGKAQRMAIEAASIMNLDIAGVDLVKDNSSGNWYCLEVNRGPQLATGAFKQEKVKIFANYIKKQQEKILL